MSLTDGESLRSARLKEVGKDGDEWQQAARHDDSDDVVERVAMNPQRERRTRERLTAAVRHLWVRNNHVYR